MIISINCDWNFPLIEKELPDLRFHIIESKDLKYIQAVTKDNIVFLVFVEDIGNGWHSHYFSPLRDVAEVKGKVNITNYLLWEPK